MIISASRRTDIPAYFSGWLANRLHEGWVCVRNPFNYRQISRIELSLNTVDCIVLWTKDPSPMIDRLSMLAGYTYYFQYTLNPYGSDIEKNIPPQSDRIASFMRLSELAGKKRVLWRYDPVMLTDNYTVDYHIRAFDDIAGHLYQYTDVCTISFIDRYACIDKAMRENKIRVPTEAEMCTLAEKIGEIGRKYGLSVRTCAEAADYNAFGIKKAACIDSELIGRLGGAPLTAGRDKNQRDECACAESIDIGAYSTCLGGCAYCYASHRPPDRAQAVFDEHSPLLCGKIGDEDKISDKKCRSLKVKQFSFLEQD